MIANRIRFPRFLDRSLERRAPRWMLVVCGLIALYARPVEATTGLEDLETHAPPNIVFLLDLSARMDESCGGAIPCISDVKRAIAEVERHYDWAYYGIIGTDGNTSGDYDYRAVAHANSSPVDRLSALDAITAYEVQDPDLGNSLLGLMTRHWDSVWYYDPDRLDTFGWASTDQETHVITVTRGLPNGDRYTYDDVAWYLYNVDLAWGIDGLQNITTHTINILGSDDDAVFQDTTVRTEGDGLYVTAVTYQELVAAMIQVLYAIQQETYIRSAAIINAENQYLLYSYHELEHDEPLLQGHLKAFAIDTDADSESYGELETDDENLLAEPVWDAGVQLQQRTATSGETNPDARDGQNAARDIYTFVPDILTQLPSGSHTFQEAVQEGRMGFDNHFVADVGVSGALSTFLPDTDMSVPEDLVYFGESVEEEESEEDQGEPVYEAQDVTELPTLCSNSGKSVFRAVEVSVSDADTDPQVTVRWQKCDGGALWYTKPCNVRVGGRGRNDEVVYGDIWYGGVVNFETTFPAWDSASDYEDAEDGDTRDFYLTCDSYVGATSPADLAKFYTPDPVVIEKFCVGGQCEESQAYDGDDSFVEGSGAITSATFSCDNLCVVTNSTKDLSNVVLQFENGSTQKTEGLSGYSGTFCGTGSLEDVPLTGVWIKSGNNASGDCPGCGEYHPNPYYPDGCDDSSSSEDYTAPYPPRDVIWYEQGERRNGGAVRSERSVPEAGLEMEPADVDSAFFSLGFEGAVIVGFEVPLVNGTGDDIQIFEKTYTQCGSYPRESAELYGWDDINGQWVYIGEASNEPSCDRSNVAHEFDLGDLQWTRYVKVVDNTPAGPHNSNADGYDLNGLYALHDGDPDAQYEAEEVDGTIQGDGRYLVCHVPPGRPHAAHTLTLTRSETVMSVLATYPDDRLGACNPYDLDGNATVDTGDLQQLVDFVRGVSDDTGVKYLDSNRGDWKLGDGVNSEPTVVTARMGNYSTDPTYRAFLENQERMREDEGERDMVLVTANDGMLHAFDLDTGEEIWAWIPGRLLASDDRGASWEGKLVENIWYGHTTLLDATPVVEDVWIDEDRDGVKAADGSEWHRVAIITQGSGGPAILALDITVPSSPRFLWETTSDETVVAHGRTTGEPVIANMLSTDGTSAARDRWTVIWPEGTAAAAIDPVDNYQHSEANIHFRVVGNDYWNSGTPVHDTAGVNVHPQPDIARDLDGDGRFEEAYVSAPISVVDTDSDGDADVFYLPVSTTYEPPGVGDADQDGQTGIDDAAQPGHTWIYKMVYDPSHPDDPTVCEFFDPMDVLGTRPAVDHGITVAWNEGNGLNLYFGTGTEGGMNPEDSGYFMAVEDPDPCGCSQGIPVADFGEDGVVALGQGEQLTAKPVVYAGAVYFSTEVVTGSGYEVVESRVYGISYTSGEMALDLDGDGANDSSYHSFEGPLGSFDISDQGVLFYSRAALDSPGEIAVGSIELSYTHLEDTRPVSWYEVF